jgi:hypothetical protein
VTPSPNEANVLQQLGTFLLAVLPATGPDGLPISVLKALPNRVAEPQGNSFVMMSLLRFKRLETNVDTTVDLKFTGSIAATNLNVSAVLAGAGQLAVGSVLLGLNLVPGTVVTALAGGTGGAGNYTVAPSQTVASQTMSAGQKTMTQNQQWDIQLDFHSDPSNDISGDMATTVSTALRDEYGVNQFANQSPNFGVVPLYADDPTQRPFLNDQQQIEARWVVECALQVNASIVVPQDFADSAVLDVVDVEAAYPS